MRSRFGRGQERKDSQKLNNEFGARRIPIPPAWNNAQPRILNWILGIQKECPKKKGKGKVVDRRERKGRGIRFGDDGEFALFYCVERLQKALLCLWSTLLPLFRAVANFREPLNATVREPVSREGHVDYQ